jgi:hypothetical protein
LCYATNSESANPELSFEAVLSSQRKKYVI